MTVRVGSSPIDSRVALEHWRRASEELEERKDAIRSAFDDGGTFAEIAAHAIREQAFTALDLASKYGRGVNVLVLETDELLFDRGRSADMLRTVYALNRLEAVADCTDRCNSLPPDRHEERRSALKRTPYWGLAENSYSGPYDPSAHTHP